MRPARSPLWIAAVVFSVWLQSAENVQAAEAPEPTLWRFLGIPQCVHKVYDGVVNRFGRHPGLERREPLKRLADPDNLESEVPAIKAAAEIKTDADLARQKVKAIRYLADVGCGCSSQKADVQEALLAALDDCTEEVRYEAALAFYRASGMCDVCGSSCCGDDVTAKLKDMAYGQDDKGCPHESSARVRAAALYALNACAMLADATEPPPEEIRERPVEQPTTSNTSTTSTRPFDPSIESSLQILGRVEPAGHIRPVGTKDVDFAGDLRQPNSTNRANSQARIRPVGTKDVDFAGDLRQPNSANKANSQARIRPVGTKDVDLASDLRQPNSANEANSQSRFRGAIVTPLR